MLKRAQKEGNALAPIARAFFASMGKERAEIKKLLADQYTDMKKILRSPEFQGYSLWQVKPGSVFYTAYTVPDQVVEALLSQAAETADITQDQLREVLAFAGKGRQLLLPTEVVQQLESMQKRSDAAYSPIARLARRVQSAMKMLVLITPQRVGGYNIRNLSGDIEPVVAHLPGALKYIGEAFRELWNFYRSKPGARKLTADIYDSLNLGVMDSGYAVTEIPNVEQMQKLEELLKDRNFLVKGWKAWWKGAGTFTQFRENLLRLAVFKYLKHQLETTGKVEHYLGSRKQDVDAIMAYFGPKYAAAKLARDFMLDYGNLSVNGDFLRNYALWFWSFMELNARRWPRLMGNAVYAHPDKPLMNRTAMRAYHVLASFWQVALLYLFNHLWFPDEEEELSKYEKANPHLILGRGPDGRIIVFRNLGSLGDLTEWFGMGALMEHWDDIVAGKADWGDVGFDMFMDPVNKLGQALSPHIQLSIAALTGTSNFPDMYSRRQVKFWDELYGSLTFKDVYRELHGRIFNTGERAHPYSLTGFALRTLGITHYEKPLTNFPLKAFPGVSDPRRFALMESYALIDRFKKTPAQRGRERGSESFKTMRDAVDLGNFEAFREARKAFIKEKLALEKNKSMADVYRSFISTLGTLDPVGPKMGKAQQERFWNWLTKQQRQRVNIARHYARDLEMDMWNWWQRASKLDDTPEERAQWQGSFSKTVGSKLFRLVRPKPVRVDADDRRRGRTLRDLQRRWEHDREVARRYLKKRGLTKEQALRMYEQFLKQRYVDPAPRARHLRELRGLSW